MIFVYPNYYCLPVLKEEGYERDIHSAMFRAEDEFGDEDIDLFKQADDEYVEESLKK
jgi:hypothetical protein